MKSEHFELLGGNRIIWNIALQILNFIIWGAEHFTLLLVGVEGTQYRAETDSSFLHYISDITCNKF